MVDLKKLQTFDSISPVTTDRQKPASSKDVESGNDFKSALADVLGGSTQGVSKATNPLAAPAVGAAPGSIAGVKFSNHAIDRMQSRGIYYSPEDVAKLNEAVKKAAAKGSKDSLVLMKDSALIVSVRNNTVVTVMDQAALKENVFTNIDSTIVI